MIARAWAAIVRFLLHPDLWEREAIYALRFELQDAADSCDRCKGYGRLAMPAAWMACPKCSTWRRALKATKRC